MKLTALFLVASAYVADAFMPTGITSVAVAPTVGRTAIVSMACRENAKKMKRQRNRDNMRKFRKPKAVGRFKKPSDATATKRAAAKAAETEFVAKLFTHVADEPVEASWFNTDNNRRS